MANVQSPVSTPAASSGMPKSRLKPTAAPRNSARSVAIAPASSTPGGRRRRRAIGPRLDLDPAGERVADDALARAEARRQGAVERLPRAVVGRIAEEACHALLEGVRQLVFQPPALVVEMVG